MAEASAPTGPVIRARLRLAGTSFYHPGPFRVQLNGRTVGTLDAEEGSFPCALEALAKPEVRITPADDGAWYLPRTCQLTVETAAGAMACAAWEQVGELFAGRTARELVLPLRWSDQPVLSSAAAWKGFDGARGGDWKGTFGSVAAWVAGTPSADVARQAGFRLEVPQGRRFTWAPTSTDSRALIQPGSGATRRVAACWFDPRQVVCEITPDGRQPYRFTVYVLDYDRANRSVEASLTGPFGERLDARQVTVADMGKGVYLTWTVTGAARLQVRYTGTNAAANAVISGVFIDR